jgi:hypothetical protein
MFFICEKATSDVGVEMIRMYNHEARMTYVWIPTSRKVEKQNRKRPSMIILERF